MLKAKTQEDREFALIVRDFVRIIDMKTRPHTFSGQELYEAHLAPHLQVAGETLRERLQRSQSYNVDMMNKITAQRAEIERVVTGLERVVKDIEDSVEAARAGGLEGLRSEMWEIEQEVQATR